MQGADLYNVEILAREGPNQFCVRVRAIVLLPRTQWGSGTVLSSCRKLRRSPKDLNAAGVTTKLRRSLDWKETFCRLLVWRYATVKGHPSTMGSARHSASGSHCAFCNYHTQKKCTSHLLCMSWYSVDAFTARGNQAILLQVKWTFDVAMQD